MHNSPSNHLAPLPTARSQRAEKSHTACRALARSLRAQHRGVGSSQLDNEVATLSHRGGHEPVSLAACCSVSQFLDALS